MAELTNDTGIRTPQQIANDGGKKGPRVKLVNEITGEDVQKDWEKTHGKLDVPAYQRRGNKRRTGREPFSSS